MKMKKFSAWFFALTVLIGAIGLVACSNDDLTEKSENASPVQDVQEGNTPGVQSLSSTELATFKAKFSVKVRGGETAEAQNVAIEEVLNRFIPFLREKYDPALQEFSSFVLAVDKEKGEVSIEEASVLKPHAMTPMELAIAGSYFSDAERYATRMVDAEGENIYLLLCESGKYKGSKTTVDADIPWTKYIPEGKRVLEFVEQCIDGGGCVKVCRASISMQ